MIRGIMGGADYLAHETTDCAANSYWTNAPGAGQYSILSPALSALFDLHLVQVTPFEGFLGDRASVCPPGWL
jgi:hypothetical protein